MNEAYEKKFTPLSKVIGRGFYARVGHKGVDRIEGYIDGVVICKGNNRFCMPYYSIIISKEIEDIQSRPIWELNG